MQGDQTQCAVTLKDGMQAVEKVQEGYGDTCMPMTDNVDVWQKPPTLSQLSN